MTSLPTLMITCGIVVFTVAMVFVARALWADRSRGRARCPRCWYTLAGLKALTCPECGFVAREAREMHKTRRHGRLAAMWTGVAVLAIGVVVPGVTLHPRPLALAPTAVLAWSAAGQGGRGTLASAELVARLNEPHRSDAELTQILAVLIADRQARQPWPSSLPLAVRAGPLDAGARPLTTQVEGAEHVPTLPRITETHRARFFDNVTLVDPSQGWFTAKVRVAPDRDLRVKVPVRLVKNIDEAIRPVTGAQADEFARSALNVRLLNDGEWYMQIMPGESASVTAPGDGEGFAGMTMGFAAELRSGEEIIATTRGWYREGASALRFTPLAFPFEPAEAARVALDAHVRALSEDPGSIRAEPLTLTIRSDVAMALRDFEAGRYWAGSFTVPIGEVLK